MTIFFVSELLGPAMDADVGIAAPDDDMFF